MFTIVTPRGQRLAVTNALAYYINLDLINYFLNNICSSEPKRPAFYTIIRTGWNRPEVTIALAIYIYYPLAHQLLPIKCL
jgi:hypothetical protein